MVIPAAACAAWTPSGVGRLRFRAAAGLHHGGRRPPARWEECSSPAASVPGGCSQAFSSSRVLFPMSSSPFLSPAAVAGLVHPAVAACPLPAGVSRWAFSGSRSVGLWSRVAGGVARRLRAAGPAAAVSVGCASGCDQAVRSVLGGWAGLAVFQAAGSSAGALAGRSAACVRSVLPAAGGCLLAFPAGPCPAGVRAGRSFRGCGSGSWGSVGLALGLGLPVVVYVPAGVAMSGFAGPLGGRLSVVASGPWGAWLVAAGVLPPLLLFGG